MAITKPVEIGVIAGCVEFGVDDADKPAGFVDSCGGDARADEKERGGLPAGDYPDNRRADQG